MLIFGVPALAIIALVVGLVYDGRAQANRERSRADDAIEVFIDNTIASLGAGALARDPNAGPICEAVRRRANGRSVKLEPYSEMSRTLAERFVRELC